MAKLNIAREFSPDTTLNAVYKELFRDHPVGYMHTAVISFGFGDMNNSGKINHASPFDVVAVPYREDRLGSIMSMGKDGVSKLLDDMPPEVSAIRLVDGSTVYVVTDDGNHRTVAARNHKLETIPLRVMQSVPTCCGDRVALFSGMILEPRSDGSFFFMYNVNPKFEPMAKRILEIKGVEVVTTGLDPHAQVVHPFVNREATIADMVQAARIE